MLAIQLIIYQIAATILLPIAYAVRLAVGRESRDSFSQRLLIGKYKDTRKLIPLDKFDSVILLHGNSLGEVKSILFFIDKIEALYENCCFIITTSSTDSKIVVEQEIRMIIQAKGRGENDVNIFHHFLPLDINFLCNRFIRLVKPKIALWAESDLWPNMIDAIKSNCDYFSLVSARMSGDSAKFWMRPLANKVFRNMISNFDEIYPKSELDKNIYLKLGTEEHKIKAVIDLKILNIVEKKFRLIDDDTMQRAEVLRNIIKQSGKKVVLFASTHEMEEDVICDVYNRLNQSGVSDLIVLICPRHKSRIKQIEATIKSHNVGYNTCDILQITPENFEQLVATKNSPANIPANSPATGQDCGQNKVIVINQMGVLGLLYQIADISVMCGSLVQFKDIGGHNFLEIYSGNSVPICGPNMNDFLEITQKFVAHGALIQTHDTEQLTQAIQDSINDIDNGIPNEYVNNAKQLAVSIYDETCGTIMESIEDAKSQSR